MNYLIGAVVGVTLARIVYISAQLGAGDAIRALLLRATPREWKRRRDVKVNARAMSYKIDLRLEDDMGDERLVPQTRWLKYRELDRRSRSRVRGHLYNYYARSPYIEGPNGLWKVTK